MHVHLIVDPLYIVKTAPAALGRLVSFVTFQIKTEGLLSQLSAILMICAATEKP